MPQQLSPPMIGTKCQQARACIPLDMVSAIRKLYRSSFPCVNTLYKVVYCLYWWFILYTTYDVMVYAMMVGRLRWRVEKVGSCILTRTRVRTPVRSRKNWGMLNNNSDQWEVSIWSRDLVSTNHRRSVKLLLYLGRSVIWWAAVGLSATLHLHHATYGTIT